MTLLNFTDPIPFPPPVTSGSTIQSYTDPLGDVWVAKNGVNGGNWYRARDVLFSKMYRNAAWTMTVSTWTVFPYDTVNRDNYGLWTATGWSIPIPGLWQASCTAFATSTAAAQNMGVDIVHNGVFGAAVQLFAYTTSVYIRPQVVDTVMCAAGDSLAPEYSMSAALAGGTGASQVAGFCIYMGTG
jgi:hypothetical protein